MNKEQFNQMIEGLQNPSRIKVAVNDGYDFLMSANNKNDAMDWFKVNASTLEGNLRNMGLKWAYIIETCPDDRPFIYMLISPTMTTFIAHKLTDRAERTLPEGRTMIVSEGVFKAFNIDQYDNTPTTLLDLLVRHASGDVFEVMEP